MDVIISRAVLEHVFDLDTAFGAMHRLLKPGGRMAHKVDLRDHGLFTDGGQNALEFLTVSDRLTPGWARNRRGYPTAGFRATTSAPWTSGGTRPSSSLRISPGSRRR